MFEFGWIIGAFIAIFGALVGVGVRRITHMLYPFEFVTAIVWTAVAALIISLPIIGSLSGWWTGSPIDAAGYVSFASGYLFGYCIDGFHAYFLLEKEITETKETIREPCMRYKVKGRWAWAGQTNWWLWQRLIKKNHVFFLSETPFGDADWVDNAKYPLFPWFKRPKLKVDEYGERKAKWKSDIGKNKHPQRWVYYIKKAHGSMISISQLCFEANAVELANKATAEAQLNYTNLLHFVKAGLPRILANFIADTYRKAPGMSFINPSRAAEEMMKDLHDDEIKLMTETEKELKDQTTKEASDGHIQKEGTADEGKQDNV